jgi:hypothetical protein
LRAVNTLFANAAIGNVSTVKRKKMRDFLMRFNINIPSRLGGLIEEILVRTKAIKGKAIIKITFSNT